MKNFVPWFVAVALIGINMMVWSQYLWRPMSPLEIIPLLTVAIGSAVIVEGYFEIYAIFNKWDREDEERLQRERLRRSSIYGTRK